MQRKVNKQTQQAMAAGKYGVLNSLASADSGAINTLALQSMAQVGNIKKHIRAQQALKAARDAHLLDFSKTKRRAPPTGRLDDSGRGLDQDGTGAMIPDYYDDLASRSNVSQTNQRLTHASPMKNTIGSATYGTI